MEPPTPGETPHLYSQNESLIKNDDSDDMEIDETEPVTNFGEVLLNAIEQEVSQY